MSVGLMAGMLLFRAICLYRGALRPGVRSPAGDVRAAAPWPRRSDLRYNWACVRLAAIDAAEMEELVLDAWAMVVPRKLVEEYA